MRIRIYLWVASILLFAFVNSCKKNGSSVHQIVSWSIDNSATQSADTISFLPLFGYKYISGSKGTTKVTLGTNSSNVGSYSSGNANATVVLWVGGTQYNAGSVFVIISSNSNSKLSGSFGGTFSGSGGPTSISGNFQDVSYY